MFLRILVRKPNATEDLTDGCVFDNVIACSGFAAKIIEAYDRIPDADSKFTFPFGHYLTSAVMILMDLVAKGPETDKRYARLLRSGVEDLKIYCRKTWVSGRMMRSISRLSSQLEELFPPSTQRAGVGEGTTRRYTPL